MPFLSDMSGPSKRIGSKIERSHQLRRNFHKNGSESIRSVVTYPQRVVGVVGDGDEVGDELIDTIPRMLSEEHLDIPDTMKHAITRSFVFRIFGSMNDLSSDSSLLRVKSSDGVIYQSHSRSEPGQIVRKSEPSGDLSQTLLLGVKCESYHSNFPCSLNVQLAQCRDSSVSEIPSLRGNYRDVLSGTRMHLAIPPNGNAPNLNKVINLTSPHVHANYIRDYRGMITDQSIRKGIALLPSPVGNDRDSYDEYMLVHEAHPVMEMIFSNQELLKVREDELAPLNNANPMNGSRETRYFKIRKSIVDECIDTLVDDLRDNMPLINLKDLAVVLTRPSGNGGPIDFNDKRGLVLEPQIAAMANMSLLSAGIEDTTSSKQMENIKRVNQLDVPRYAEITLAITYAFV